MVSIIIGGYRLKEEEIKYGLVNKKIFYWEGRFWNIFWKFEIIGIFIEWVFVIRVGRIVGIKRMVKRFGIWGR